MRRQPLRRRLALALVGTARGFLATDGTMRSAAAAVVQVADVADWTRRNLQASDDGCGCVDFAMPAMTCDDYIASPDGGEGWSALDGVSACGWIEANWPYGGGPADGYAGCDGCCCGARSDARGYRTAAEDAASGCDSWDALVATADCVIRPDVTISVVEGSSYTIASGASASIRGAGEAYSTIAGSSIDGGMPIFALDAHASLELADLTIESGHNSADAGAIRMEASSTLTVSRVVFRGHVGMMGAIVANGAYDGAPAASLAFYSTQFHENSAMHVRVGSGTTAAFYDCAFGALTDFDDAAMPGKVQYGALFLEENARADLYSCDFEAPWTLWMHPSAVAHVYCTYPAGLQSAYESWDEWGNLVDSSAGTLVDYSGQGCPGDATVVAMDDGTIRTAVAAWLANATAAEAAYGHISTWKTGEVTDMSGLFENSSSFNDDISPWDTSGVTTMNGMFSKTSSFNQPIGAWDTSGVRRMDWMFVGSAFNQPIGD